MGPQDPKDVVGQVAHDLTQRASDLARTKADPHYWLEGPEYAPLRHRLDNAHATVEAALIEARRRVRMNERRER
jgi:hypothetical protein